MIEINHLLLLIFCFKILFRKRTHNYLPKLFEYRLCWGSLRFKTFMTWFIWKFLFEKLRCVLQRVVRGFIRWNLHYVSLLNKAYHKSCHCCFAIFSYYKSRIWIILVTLTSNTACWHAQMKRKTILHFYFKVLIKTYKIISPPIMCLLFSLPEKKNGKSRKIISLWILIANWFSVN